jgi:hypothetical protein
VEPKSAVAAAEMEMYSFVEGSTHLDETYCANAPATAGVSTESQTDGARTPPPTDENYQLGRTMSALGRRRAGEFGALEPPSAYVCRGATKTGHEGVNGGVSRANQAGIGQLQIS